MNHTFKQELKLICPVETDGGNGNNAVLRWGGNEVLAVVGTLALQRLSQCRKWGWMCKSVWENETVPWRWRRV